MPVQLDKARKLISDLEDKLNATSAHAAEARRLLDEWVHEGEATLRKKSAAALKQMRKRADSFAKSLAKWEKHMSASMEKMAASMAKDKADAKKEKASAAAGKPAPAKPAAKKAVARKKPTPAKKTGTARKKSIAPKASA